MSVDRRIKAPSKAEFAATAVAIMHDVGLDEALAEDIFARLSPEAQAVARMADIVHAVHTRVEPDIVGMLYEPMQAN